MEISIQHDPRRKQFIAEVNGERGILDYEVPKEGIMDLLGTFVPQELRHKGSQPDGARSSPVCAKPAV